MTFDENHYELMAVDPTVEDIKYNLCTIIFLSEFAHVL